MNDRDPAPEPTPLRRCEEAIRLIERIDDPTLRAQVKAAFVHLMNEVYVDGVAAPFGGFDAEFFAASMGRFFERHSAIIHTLDGRRLGGPPRTVPHAGWGRVDVSPPALGAASGASMPLPA